MSTAIIDYGSGNLRSVEKALERAASNVGAGDVFVSADADKVAKADRILLPGVGAFADCKQGLDALDGMIDVLQDRVRKQGTPFLGICVGMQLMAREGLEHGTTPGLGWIDGVVDRIVPADPSLKVPHMGWNEVKVTGSHPVFADWPEGAHCYFANSYQMKVENPAQLLAEVDYGGPITAAVTSETALGLQFHPEKSQKIGAMALEQFLSWKP